MSIHNKSNSPDARTVDPNRPFLDTPLPGLAIRKWAKPSQMRIRRTGGRTRPERQGPKAPSGCGGLDHC